MDGAGGGVEVRGPAGRSVRTCRESGAGSAKWKLSRIFAAPLIGHEPIEPLRELIAVRQPKPALFHLEIFCADAGVGRVLGELPAMGRSRKTFPLPWPDMLKHGFSEIEHTPIQCRSADKLPSTCSRSVAYIG